MAYHRQPRTTAERREAENTVHDDTLGVGGARIKVRAKRNFRRLPNSWDDLPREWDRSWKKSRKTQYRVK